MTQPTLINLRSNNTTNFTTINLRLNYIHRVKVLILLMTYLITCALRKQNKREDLNLGVFNMITRINKSKKFTKFVSANANVNLMEGYVIQNNGGIKNVNLMEGNVIQIKGKIKNVNLMEENIIQINGGMMIHVDVSVKSVIYVRKNIFGILLDVAVKMENI